MTSKKEVKEKAESLKKKFWNDKTIVWGLNCLMIFILVSLLITK